MDKHIFRAFWLLLYLLTLSIANTFANNYPVQVSGKLFYYNTDYGRQMPLTNVKVEIWDSDLPTTSTIADDWIGSQVINLDGSFSIAGSGGDPGDYSYSRPDIYVRVVLIDPSGLVRLTDELNGVQSYIIGLHQYDNVQGTIDIGTYVIDQGKARYYGTKMMVFQGAVATWNDFTIHAGEIPASGFLDVLYWAGVYSGTPWTNNNTIHWPIGYQVYKTDLHEFGHIIRHSYDGDRAHWDGDDGLYTYARYHSCNSKFTGYAGYANLAFAFNEGWAEFWAEEFCSLSDPMDFEVEGNVANALNKLAAALPNGKWDLCKVLKSNPGTIHSFDEFRQKALLQFPALSQVSISGMSQSGSALVSYASATDQQKEYVKETVRLLALEKLSVMDKVKAARIEGDRNYDCTSGDCEKAYYAAIRPRLLTAEIQLLELEGAYLIKSLEGLGQLGERFSKHTFDPWFEASRRKLAAGALKIHLSALNDCKKILDGLGNRYPQYQALAAELNEKTKRLGATLVEKMNGSTSPIILFPFATDNFQPLK